LYGTRPVQEEFKEFMMSKRFEIGRREFLVASSTVVAAAATMGPQLFAAAPASAKRLAVGFVPLHRPDESLVSAATLPSGDGGFISRGARIALSGTSGGSHVASSRRAVELLVEHSYFDGAQERNVPFLAWAASRMTGDQGNTVNFTVPVDQTQMLSMHVRAESGSVTGSSSTRRRAIGSAGSGLQTELLPLVFGIQNDAAIKLNRGFYVVVPVFAGESDPNWQAYTLERVDGRWALKGWAEVASFEHLVLSIDYAV
jgi:hypothetical protein